MKIPMTTESQEKEILQPQAEQSADMQTKQKMAPEQEAKLKEMVEQLDKEGKQIIPLPFIPQEIKDKLTFSIGELKKLHDDISGKKEIIVATNQKIQVLAHNLAQSKKVTINEQELAMSSKSSEKYIELLDTILNEVKTEVDYYSQFTQEEHPEFIVVWKEEPPHGILFLMSKVKWIKKYIKTIRKDVHISFSRYSFGFDNQIKKLEQTQAFITHAQTHAH